MHTPFQTAGVLLHTVVLFYGFDAQARITKKKDEEKKAQAKVEEADFGAAPNRVPS